MKISFLLFFQLVFIIVKGQSEIDFVRTNEYKPIKLSMNDFKKLINVVIYYYNDSKQIDDYKLKTLRDSAMSQFYNYGIDCELSENQKAIKLSNFSQLRQLDIGNENFNRLSIIYTWRNKTISNVTINLNNSYRQISVSGNDETKVNAMYREIDDLLKSNETFISWNIPIQFISTFIFIGIFFFTWYKVIPMLFEKYRKKKDYIVIFISFLILLGFVVFYFSAIRIQDIFPDFELINDKTLWYNKYAGLIGLIGLVIGILSLPKFITKKIYKNTTDIHS